MPSKNICTNDGVASRTVYVCYQEDYFEGDD